MPEDHDLPLLDLLLDVDRARPMVETALASSAGSLRLDSVSLTPGRLVVARYSVGDISLTAMHGPATPEGGLRVADGADEVAIWRFPDDPALPGLAVVLGDGLRAVLGDLGLPDDSVKTRVRAYQPGRRAVVEIRTAGHRLFAKVVRPKRVAELQQVHAALAPTLPVPRSLGWDRTLGIVMLEAVPGVSVAASLVAGSPSGVAGPDDLVPLLDLIARCDIEGRPRRPPVVGAARHVATLGIIDQDSAGVAESVVDALSNAPEEPAVTAHRDFHASQLLVHEGRLRLVDVDTVGRGSRADDLAMLLAQLTCLAKPGEHRDTVIAYRDLAQNRFEELVDARSLRLRTAASIIGFSLGPFRTQSPNWRAETRRRVAAANAYAVSALKFDTP